ncbi:MAG: hypothetical protein AAFY28_15660 [Actinomycetota bacterium]
MARVENPADSDDAVSKSIAEFFDDVESSARTTEPLDDDAISFLVNAIREDRDGG